MSRKGVAYAFDGAVAAIQMKHERQLASLVQSLMPPPEQGGYLYDEQMQEAFHVIAFNRDVDELRAQSSAANEFKLTDNNNDAPVLPYALFETMPTRTTLAEVFPDAPFVVLLSYRLLESARVSYYRTQWRLPYTMANNMERLRFVGVLNPAYIKDVLAHVAAKGEVVAGAGVRMPYRLLEPVAHEKAVVESVVAVSKAMSMDMGPTHDEQLRRYNIGAKMQEDGYKLDETRENFVRPESKTHLAACLTYYGVLWLRQVLESPALEVGVRAMAQAATLADLAAAGALPLVADASQTARQSPSVAAALLEALRGCAAIASSEFDAYYPVVSAFASCLHGDTTDPSARAAPLRSGGGTVPGPMDVQLLQAFVAGDGSVDSEPTHLSGWKIDTCLDYDERWHGGQPAAVRRAGSAGDVSRLSALATVLHELCAATTFAPQAVSQRASSQQFTLQEALKLLSSQLGVLHRQVDPRRAKGPLHDASSYAMQRLGGYGPTRQLADDLIDYMPLWARGLLVRHVMAPNVPDALPRLEMTTSYESIDELHAALVGASCHTLLAERQQQALPHLPSTLFDGAGKRGSDGPAWAQGLDKFLRRHAMLMKADTFRAFMTGCLRAPPRARTSTTSYDLTDRYGDNDSGPLLQRRRAESDGADALAQGNDDPDDLDDPDDPDDMFS